MMTRYVIVGAGLSGHQAALELGRHAEGCSVTLIGAEPGLPYDRPPLSKAILTAEEEQHNLIALPGTDRYAELGISHYTRTTVAAIDRGAKTVVTQCGRTFRYDRLLLATGSRPREMSSGSASEHQFLRVLDDALRLRRVLAKKGRVAVVGGGFLGLEVAAAARLRGCNVTVLEASPRLLARGTPRFLSDWVLQLHRSRGVTVEVNASVDEVRRSPEGGYEVFFGDHVLAADAIVLAIGVTPNTELADDCGLVVENGIVVDEHCRTSDPSIFAAGEATAHPNWPDGRLRRIETWRTSLEHGVAAGQSMRGAAIPFNTIPWFWSDQFEQNIQSVGFPEEASRYALADVSTNDAWTLIGLDREGGVIGAVAANRGRDISAFRRILREARTLPRSIRLLEL
jgi:NADPH-dependent 2,4-dienoyl-CoA reductase/sulfur reductase-like enzyme